MEQTNLETREMKLHRCKEDGMYGFADENGNVLIPCVYDSVRDFKDGVALVSKEFEGPVFGCDIAYFYIDEDGDFLGAALLFHEEDMIAIVKARKLAAHSRYEEAIECLKPVAENDEICGSDARYNLVDYLCDSKRYEEAIQWCEKTYEQWIERNLRGQDPTESFPEIEWAICRLAEIYEEGIGMEKDLLKAFKYYNLLVEMKQDERTNQKVKEILEENPHLRELPEVSGSYSVMVEEL